MNNSSHKPTDFCCNTSCSNCRFSLNKECVANFSKKKKCNVDFYKNSFQVLGKDAFNTYNINYGYFPEDIKCLCRSRGHKCRMKTYKQCNCSMPCIKLSALIRKKLSQNKSYMKVNNRYGDITYNSVDGWPPTMAQPTGYLNGTLYLNPNSTKLERLRNMEQQVIARAEKRYYRYNGKIYGYREKVAYPPNSKTCKIEVYKVPTAVKIT